MSSNLQLAVASIPIVIGKSPTTGHIYSPQPQATTQCMQSPDALGWRLMELSVVSRQLVY